MDNRSKNLEEIAEKMQTLFKSAIQRHVHQHKFEHIAIGRPHIGILFILGQYKNGISINDLAHKLNVTAGAITQVVDKLVENNLVQRHEDKKDRRILKVKLSDFAKNKFGKFRANYIQEMNTMFKDLSDDELSELVNLLKKIKIPGV